MDLLTHCQEHGWRKLAFIGIAKHAGKTTALNGYLQQLAETTHKVGLLSVGVDGERLDSILGVPKPRVYVEVGTIIASAEAALLDSEARFEWLRELPISSPLGPVMIARVTTPGTVVLAGIRQRVHVKMACDELLRLGSDYVLVDGAFDRVAAATPDLVDAAVLAVGAVVGRTAQDVVAHAQPVIRRFQLPQASDAWKRTFGKARDNGSAAIAVASGQHAGSTNPELSSAQSNHVEPTSTKNNDAERSSSHSNQAGHTGDNLSENIQVLQLPAHAVMFDVTGQSGWCDDAVGIYIPGAVTDGVIEGLLRHPRCLEIVADHPVQVLISGDTHRRLLRHGHRLSVWNELPLAAIAANPHHINGFDLSIDDLIAKLAKVAGDIPVYDALAREAAPKAGDSV